MEENRQLQSTQPQDIVEEDFRSEAEQHVAKVAILFGGSIPLVAVTQLLGLGMTGMVISGVVIAVVAVAGKHTLKVIRFIPGGQQLAAQIPTFHWNRLIGQPDAEEEVIDDRKVIDADPARPSLPSQQEQEGDRPQGERENEHQDENEPRDQESDRRGEQEVDTDALFQLRQAPVTSIAMPRLKCNQIIKNTPPNSYQICIGRSLIRKDAPPVWISFYKKHLKLIGTSTYGKSSMAAAIIYLITRTHSPEKVLFALLDLEYKTSRLFEDIPHLAQVDINGRPVILHAKNEQQVLEYLGYILDIVEERYKLTEEELINEPILEVYLEEFLDLKDFFKRRKDETEEYAQLIYRVDKIARRGLKVKVQFLMCAQVDYRDEDFREALANVKSGMSFCVAATAARAAGFTQTALLNRNVELDEKGVAVVEMPECKDLVHAVEFNLEQKLLTLAQSQRQQNPSAAPRQRQSILGAAGQGNRNDQLIQQKLEEVAPRQEYQPEPAAQIKQTHEDQAEAPQVNPNIHKLTHLHRRVLEHYYPGLPYRELGEMIDTGKDKAGELLADLRRWGFLPQLPPKEKK